MRKKVFDGDGIVAPYLWIDGDVDGDVSLSLEEAYELYTTLPSDLLALEVATVAWNAERLKRAEDDKAALEKEIAELKKKVKA